ncbi:hypothetical protein [Brevundimonas sp. P7753]|uniref:hypothetical protein n=1 Tax=Brevundimonas sp. P7753 TaxID=2726982 RepID=UPI0015BB999F|nr:hypothetical protein [Brevundimonas sp. P7753]NWE53816.1 hypothetical protein [Brevundimonas sp. P7753]
MTAPPSILLIDDNEQLLASLSAKLRERLGNEPVEIALWTPATVDEDPEASFKNRIDEKTVLVVTDYDLTSKGLRGLFGVSIVAWSQMAAVPVGDFSRGHRDSLPKEPNLFALKVPNNDEDGATFIAAIYAGFRDLASGLDAQPDLLKDKRSLAGVLAALMGRPHLESQFALYMSRLGAANAGLIERLRTMNADGGDDLQPMQKLMTYILGHVLANSILKFPGPILSDNALAAYCATSNNESDALAELFHDARYGGPFSQVGRFYWREDVDGIIDAMSADVAVDGGAGFADFNRAVVQARLARVLAVHECGRCGGEKGGFWCPFTKRPVCERADCSVPSSSWIPQGAQLTRVERDFYEELAPLMGL